MNKIFVTALLLLTIYILSCNYERSNNNASAQLALPDVVDFNFHVKPILSDKCFKCHGPDENTREAGLAFHDETLAFKSLDESAEQFAIVPKDTANSLLIKAIHSTDPSEQMPPPESNLVLTDYEKKILEKWIIQGAEWKQHWSFSAPQAPGIPEETNNWIINDIDRFVLKRMQQEGLEPSPMADKAKLLRRLSFTLTGLPPTTAELESFLKDDGENAYEARVDNLLSTSAYAEHMAQIWMDLARYADSHGYQDDPQRFMWPWRDWVIHAYDKNMPFNDFVTWQLAGDMLPDASMEQIIASGFNRNHKITYEGGSISEEFRTEYVADRTHTFGTAFLGLTVECARCHDHKYDPFSQQNYYELFAFFNNVPEEGFVEPVGRTPEPFVTLTKEEIAKNLQFIQGLDTVSKLELMVMEEMDQPRPAYILNRGQYDKPTTEVFPLTPKSVLDFADRPQNRLGLADWLFDPNHPLTARVAVNRLWQQVFGSGIVASSFDFGNQGTLPTHPKLLDYLALQYQQKNWDTKAMLKKMVMSATFRQSSQIDEELLKKDPENMLLARYSRLRLSSEMIRDQVLKSAGILQTTVGGPSVKPYQPEGLWEETIGGGGDLRKYVQDEGDKLYRRSLYTFWKRTVPPPSMITFDSSTKDLCTVKRQETNTPLQALVLMNDPQIVEAARILAHTALALKETDLSQKVAFIFEKMTSRPPTEAERNLLEKYYNEEIETFREDKSKAEAYLAIGSYQINSPVAIEELAAFTLLANMICNLDEVINRG